MADPDRPVRELPSLGSGEAARLMELGRGPDDARAVPATVIERAEPATVVERLDRMVSLYPDAAAVASGSAAVTYGELDQRANRLARELRAAARGRNGSSRSVSIARSNTWSRSSPR